MSDKEDVELKDSKEEQKTYDLYKFEDMFSMFHDNLEEKEIKKLVSEHLRKLIKGSKITNTEIVFLYDDHSSISNFHSGRIYSALKDIAKKKDILMILLSDGGSIEPAYLISKTCKRLSKSLFSVAIPRKAKSAATLISLGADKIHMGLLSELGPIDPQFGGLPALGLSNALEKIAELSDKYPKSSEMFAKFLTDNMNIRHLGYYERVNESAAQYAERLLNGKKFAKSQTETSLANHFTNHYKDHSFVIDADEASSLLGNDIIQESTPEYELANKCHEFLDILNFLFGYVQKKHMRYVGSIENGMDLNDIMKEV